MPIYCSLRIPKPKRHTGCRPRNQVFRKHQPWISSLIVTLSRTGQKPGMWMITLTNELPHFLGWPCTAEKLFNIRSSSIVSNRLSGFPTEQLFSPWSIGRTFGTTPDATKTSQWGPASGSGSNSAVQHRARASIASLELGPSSAAAAADGPWPNQHDP